MGTGPFDFPSDLQDAIRLRGTVFHHGSAIPSGSDAKFARIKITDSSLFAAIRIEQLDRVKYLLDHGANVNARMEEVEHDWGGTLFAHFLTPLVVAIRTGNIDIARFLLERGAKVNTEGGNTNVPLYEAVTKGRTDMICLLLNQEGIDVNAYQNVRSSWDDYESTGYSGGDFHQVPETALGYINRINSKLSVMPNEWQVIVNLLRDKGAR
jgi:ankyrin repeat protein